MCPSCHNYVETPKHFFIGCVSHNIVRENLIRKLIDILKNFNAIYDCNDSEKLLSMILFGLEYKRDLANKINECLCYAVIQFMSGTKRSCKI